MLSFDEVSTPKIITPRLIPENLELDVEEFDNDFDDEDFEEESKAIQLIRKQLPMLGKLLDKIPKKQKVSSDEDSTRTEIGNNEVLSKTKAESFIDKNLPFLNGLMEKLNKKNKKDEIVLDPNSITPITYAKDEEAEKPKRKVSVIHIIVIIGLVYMAYDEFFAEPTPESETKVAAPKIVPKYKKNLKKPIQEPAPEVAKPVIEESNVQVDTEVPVDISSPSDPVEDAPIENSEDLGLNPEISNEPAVEETPEEIIEKPTNELSKEDSKEDENIEDNFEENSKDQVDETIVVDPNLGQSDDNNNRNDIGITDEVVDSSVTTDITESILKDLEVKVNATKEKENLIQALSPVAAPEYEIIGRGLVYNCAGKHWACIDSVSFKTCQQNYSWNSQKNKEIECYPLDNYDTMEDCAAVQQYKIDSVTDTKFCN